MSGIIILTATAFVLSLILVIADSLVKDNKEEQEILNMLPKLNCNLCGFGSCKGMAKEIIRNKEVYKKCKPLTDEGKAKLENYLLNSAHYSIEKS